MEELTIEEKAKAYDEALKRAKEINKKNIKLDPGTTTCEYIFPELKDSKDNKIRNRLIHIVNGCLGVTVPEPEKSQLIAWLEKQGKIVAYYEDRLDESACKYFNKGYKYALENQGEQKIVDKIEPKFKIGDWITNGACTIQITSIDDRYYWHDNDCIGGDIESIDKEYHLWTINDAKEGDVLAYVTDEDDLWIMIYRSLYEPYEGHVHYHALLVNDNFSDKGTCCICINDLKPATKEQRDTFFAKMKDAGYEWNAEKKELKKINSYCQEHCKGYQETGKCFADGDCKDKREAEQKSAWSEEDKRIIRRIDCLLYSINESDFEDIHAWLKSLKDRVQPKQKWNEEDNEWIESLIQTFEGGYLEGFNQLESYGVIDWLKTLKQRI